MAGGVGKRMGNTELPKQFLKLADKPILIHTLEKFIIFTDFERILVSAHPNWVQYTKDLIDKFINDKRIIVIEGGQERNDTVMAAISYIEKKYGPNATHTLLMHDAVRPFVTHRIIRENIVKSKEFMAVDTLIGATDTIVSVDGGVITDIPVRDRMYQGQTPQTVNIDKFKEYYNSMSATDKLKLSDSAKVMLLAGCQVGVVKGELSNTKITTPYDLKISEIIAREGLDVH